jgi:hypothetical protein
MIFAIALSNIPNEVATRLCIQLPATLITNNVANKREQIKTGGDINKEYITAFYENRIVECVYENKNLLLFDTFQNRIVVEAIGNRLVDYGIHSILFQRAREDPNDYEKCVNEEIKNVLIRKYNISAMALRQFSTQPHVLEIVEIPSNLENDSLFDFIQSHLSNMRKN